MKLLIINGPNLNLLGSREKDIYGNQSFDDYLKELQSVYQETEIEVYQSNVEGELINALHDTESKYDGVILNGGAYTHTSIAIADAIAAISTPVIEVHISNVYAREDFRQISHFAAHCQGVISGFGLRSYDLAIQHFLGS
jgi:3-dehydroquinate dehydratase-2